MWHYCNDCGYEMDPDVYPEIDVDSYGCPVCGSHDIDDEVE